LTGWSRLSMRCMTLMRSINSLEAVERSESRLWRRQHPSQAHVPSTTQRLGNQTTPVVPGGRRTLSKRHWPGDCVAIHWVRS